MNAERGAFKLRDDPGPRGSVRMVTPTRRSSASRRSTRASARREPGLLSRSEAWWKTFLLADPEHWRDGASPKYYAYLELDGQPAGYALYRVKPKWEEGTPQGELRVNDAIATSPEATAELWRYLFGIDLVTRVKAGRIDPASRRSWSRTRGGCTSRSRRGSGCGSSTSRPRCALAVSAPGRASCSRSRTRSSRATRAVAGRPRARPHRRRGGRRARRRGSRLGVPGRVLVRAAGSGRSRAGAARRRARARDRALRDADAALVPGGF